MKRTTFAALLAFSAAGILPYVVSGFSRTATTLVGSGFGRTAQDPATLHSADAPPNSVWVDTLELSKAMIRRPRTPRGQTTPPAPLVFKLGGVVYQHAVPLQSNADLAIDLDGQAVRFTSMVGIDDDRQPGQGSVTFEVWVDGKKVADSGLMKGGDAPKSLSVDLTGAKRMILAVGDGGDGIQNDSADWSGALIVMAQSTSPRPRVVELPADPPPSLA